MTVQYLIDSENVGDFWIPLLELPGDKTELVVFYTRNSPHMSYDSLIRLKQSDRTVTFIRCYEGTNALDFQLVSELGYRISKNEDGKFVIVTNDTGFDAAVKYWRRNRKSVKRITGKECRNIERRVREDLTETKPAVRMDRMIVSSSAMESAAAASDGETAGLRASAAEEQETRSSRPNLRDVESASLPEAEDLYTAEDDLFPEEEDLYAEEEMDFSDETEEFSEEAADYSGEEDELPEETDDFSEEDAAYDAYDPAEEEDGTGHYEAVPYDSEDAQEAEEPGESGFPAEESELPFEGDPVLAGDSDFEGNFEEELPFTESDSGQESVSGEEEFRAEESFRGEGETRAEDTASAEELPAAEDIPVEEDRNGGPSDNPCPSLKEESEPAVPDSAVQTVPASVQEAAGGQDLPETAPQGAASQETASHDEPSQETAPQDMPSTEEEQAPEAPHRSKSRRSRSRRAKSAARKQEADAQAASAAEPVNAPQEISAEETGSQADPGLTGEEMETAETGSRQPSDEEIAKIVACIGAENLAELHNQLATLYGDQGKDLYLSIRNNTRSYPVLKPDLSGKFAYYCEIIFARSDYSGEYPSDISEFLLSVREKLNNLNSLRYALQKHYGKEKGRRFYFILKPFAKTMYQM